MLACLRPLRTYTTKFAKKMSELYPQMLKDVKPSCRGGDEELIAALCFGGFGDMWEDAELRSVARYLLGAKGLKVPSKFEGIIPSQL